MNKIDHNKDGKVTFDDFHLFVALMPHPVNGMAIFEKFHHYSFFDDSMGEYT